MKNLQETGTYLEEKAKFHRNISMIFFAIGGLGLLVSFLITNFTLIFIFIISLSIGGFFFKFYLNYSGGLQGEQITIEALQNLPDSYYWLALQSLIVVSMALWFRNKLIVIMNGILYSILLISLGMTF